MRRLHVTLTEALETALRHAWAGAVPKGRVLYELEDILEQAVWANADAREKRSRKRAS